MKMKKTTIITAILIIFILNIVTAQTPPFQASDSSINNELNIIFPKNPAFLQGGNFSLHFHVYNSSGSIQTDTDVSYCTIHIYNLTNEHMLKQNLTYDGNEWEIKLNDSLSSNIGYYPYVVWCDGVVEDGYISTTYLITRTGTIKDDNASIFPYIFFLIGTITLLFFFGNMIDTSKEWLQAIKLLTNMIGLFMLLIGAGFITRTLYLFNYPITIVNIANIVYFTLLFTVIPILIIFIVMFIRQLLDFWEELRSGEKFD